MGNKLKQEDFEDYNSAELKIDSKEDVSIIIAWRNIGIERLENCLKSLKNQDYNQELIKIILVDYGGNDNCSFIVKKLCEKCNVKYIRVEEYGEWCKPHALNIGIKNSNAKYTLISDIDIIFEKNYINECVKEIQKNHFKVLYSKCLDCPKDLNLNDLDIINDFHSLKKRCNKRGFKKDVSMWYGYGICFSLSYFFKTIRGYDEFYTVWGSEDLDIIKRFELMGLVVKEISDRTSYIHQHHPKHEGYGEIKKVKSHYNINKKYLLENNSILRNSYGWGENRIREGLQNQFTLINKKFVSKQRFFKSPPLSERIVKSIKLIAPQYDLSVNEKSRDFWEIEQNASCWSEDEVFSKFFETIKKSNKILDIGPGFGRSTIFLKKRYDLNNSNFHLYEGEGDKPRYTVLGPRFKDSFCGNLFVLKKYLDYNCIKNYEIFEAKELNFSVSNLPGPYDIIYSFYAIGFHWSLEHYLDEILGLMHDDSLAFFIVHRKFTEFEGLKKVNYKLFDLDSSYTKNKGLKMLVISKGRFAGFGDCENSMSCKREEISDISLRIQKLKSILDNKKNKIRHLKEVSKNPSKDLAIVCCYFNPCHYKNLFQNYKIFRKGIEKTGVKLLTVELAFGDDNFELSEFQNILQLRTPKENIMWQKERLLNIGIQKLIQEGYNKIAWLDADIVFENDNWVTDLSKNLDEYPVVQVFSEVYRKGWGDLITSSVKYFKKNNEFYSAGTGFAWAARAELLKEINLYDYDILGGGDSLIFYACYFYGDTSKKIKKLNTFTKALNPSQVNHYFKWAKKWGSIVKGNVGFLNHRIKASYHGSYDNRKYIAKKEIFRKYNFDPDKDVIIGPDFCLNWVSDKPDFHKDVKQYFYSRKEDQ